MASSLSWRPPLSDDGMWAPLIEPLVYRGSSPRTWTYFPSPSSRSRETLGSRPMASAILVFGRLVITSAGRTSTMFWALFCW